MRYDIRDIATREFELAEKMVKESQSKNGKLVIYTNAKDKGSVIYLHTLVAELEKISINSLIILPQDGFKTAMDFNQSLKQMCATPDVCAIMIQRPVQPQLMESELTVATELARSVEYGWKFVDKKFDEVNMLDEENYPCTAVALMAAIRIVYPSPDERSQKMAAIINRSQNVGRPLAQLLMNAQVTTAVCNSKTPRTKLWALMKESSIIVTATGVAGLFTASDYNEFVPNTTDRRLIIDVGTPGDIHDELDSQLLDAPNVYYLPAKRGIGMLTTAVLVKNIARNFAKISG